MKLVPLADRVVLKALEAEETTKSGIVLPGQAQEKPQQAEIIAVGPGGLIEGKEVKMFVEVGQKVIYLDPVSEEYKTATVAAIDPDGVPRLKLYDSPFCPWNENRNNRLDGYKFRLVK